jgi:dolichyl-phosphate-mannose-protein mannosyltransferase
MVDSENGLVTQSRLILLDSPLVAFTALTDLAFTCFTNQHEQGPEKAFQPLWWFWLAFTGLALGATASVKWVGLFTIAWVGSLTLVQLWVLLGDTQTVTPRKWFKHFFARAFCLIVIPIAFYMAMFGIHFLCLVNPGEGDGFMSSEFQASLNGKGMQNVPADVAFGSRIALRHHNTQGGYLHSHNHMYPTGSKQQQITLYPHKDENNVWLLENQTLPEIEPKVEGPFAWDNLDVTKIKDGDVVRLYHVMSHRRLHSHDQRPPVTEADWQQEVTAYGYEGFEGDANDYFRIEIVKSMSDGKGKESLRTIESKFKLVHIMSGCVLFSHKVKLPDWGFEQQEVTCAKGGTLPNSVWYIEGNEHPRIGPDAEVVNYKIPNFFAKFWELQKVMWRTNAGLVESHAWDSRPPSWPILRRGINFWGKEHRQIYLMGNMFTWWSVSAAVLLYVAVKGLAVLRWQRGFADYKYLPFKRFDYEVGSTMLGWALHYFPFFLMARQLFLHHYFPALYFGIIALCQTYDFIFGRLNLGPLRQPVVRQTVAVAALAIAIFVFTQYMPLIYGGKWTQAECKRVRLFDTWDWDCNSFLDSYDAYDRLPSTMDAGIPSSPVAKIEEPKSDAHVTPQDGQPPAAPIGGQPQGQPGKVINREEKIEYRDEKGNLLNDEQVAELKGKVSFQVRPTASSSDETIN